MAIVDNSQLGKDVEYRDRYSPELLFPISREESRSTLGVRSEDLPFIGQDVWTSFEVSWLETTGKPAVAIGIFRVPSNSPNIIESKSFKLYLNSFNQERFDHRADLISIMEKDLSAAAGAQVRVELTALENIQSIEQPHGQCVDAIESRDFVYEPDAGLLKLAEAPSEPNSIDNQVSDGDHAEVSETLYSNLLRSNCPVTGQPDWGTVVVSYSGRKIDHESLLRYIVSFRTCQDFHEHCVERMFVELLAQCECRELSVMARYTRRGGLDINPYRATRGFSPDCPKTRFVRQ